MDLLPRKLPELKDNHGREIESYLDVERQIKATSNNEEKIYFLLDQVPGEYCSVYHFSIAHLKDGKEVRRVGYTGGLVIDWK